MSITGILRKNAQLCTEELESAMLHAESDYVANADLGTREICLHKHREYELSLLTLTKKYALYHPKNF